MGCIYEDRMDGTCTIYDENIEMGGCDENGICCCSEDPDPSVTCGFYESDYTCMDCGCDLNVEECDCDDY